MGINKVCVSGNLTQDAELRATAGGMAVLRFRLAVSERRKNPQTGQWGDVPNYFSVTVFGKRGEALAQYLPKGKHVTVSGALRWHEWMQDDGARREAVEIIADQVDLGPRQSGTPLAPAEAESRPQAAAPTYYCDTDIPF